jgi:integrase
MATIITETPAPKAHRASRRARRGTGHVYQRGAIWWIKYYVNGIARAESSGSTKASVAQDLLTDRLGRLQRHEPILPTRAGKVMYAEAAEDLRAAYATTGTRNLVELGCRLAALHTFFAPYRLAAIDSAAVDQYMAFRLKQGRAGGTVNREVSVLRRVLAKAVKNKKLTVVPDLSEAHAQEAPARRGFLEPEDFLRVRAHLAPDLQVAATLGYQLGWRLHEVLGLAWRHVDLRRGRICLDASMTKTKRARDVALTPELVELLRHQRRRVAELQIKLGAGELPWVFPHLPAHFGHRDHSDRSIVITEIGGS